MAAPGTTLSRNRRGQFRPAAPSTAPPGDTAEESELLDETELAALAAEQMEILDEHEPGPEATELSETAQAALDDPDVEAESASGQPPDQSETAVAHGLTLRRVQAMLQEALRLGRQMGLVELQADGTLAIAGQTPRRRRADSECHCQRCTPYAQQHWWCVVCHSGPHEWQMVKPQYERQTLKPGGIEGVRQAACSAQCARDYLSSLGRQPQLNSGVDPHRLLDPTLGLPGASHDERPMAM